MYPTIGEDGVVALSLGGTPPTLSEDSSSKRVQESGVGLKDGQRANVVVVDGKVFTIDRGGCY